MYNLNLDKKDRRILAELDMNFRTPFSKIGKEVGLSKNSVGLRFTRLESLMSHNITGVNYLALGYRMIKIFYSLNKYDNGVENKIINIVKKNNNILWAARIFGNYDLEICYLVKNIEELIYQVSSFERNLIDIVDNKNILIIEKEFFHKYSFLHEKKKHQTLIKPEIEVSLSNSEKKILLILRPNPRATILEISKKSGLAPGTITKNIKHLQNKGIIIGYFLSLDLSKFNLEVYKLLIQIQKIKNIDKFEDDLCSIDNAKHISKTLGSWDYEIDIFAQNLKEIHNQIIDLKNKFPSLIKRIAIITHGKRLITNKEGFLK